MLVCYLDDSGKDPQNSITTLAGYIARDTQWEAFEAEVEHWFKEFGVRVLHAKELHDTDGDFKGWTVLKKQAFVSRVCQARTPHLMIGAKHVGPKGKIPSASSRKRPGPDGHSIHLLL
jgi:hypothetical protein